MHGNRRRYATCCKKCNFALNRDASCLCINMIYQIRIHLGDTLLILSEAFSSVSLIPRFSFRNMVLPVHASSQWMTPDYGYVHRLYSPECMPEHHFDRRLPKLLVQPSPQLNQLRYSLE